MIGEKILKHQNISFAISIALIFFSLILATVKGVPKSVEFIGGTLIEVKLSNSLDIENFNNKLLDSIKKIDPKLAFHSQWAGEKLLSIKFSLAESLDKLEQIKTAIADSAEDKTLSFERIDDIGPQVSEELVKQSFIAIFFAFLAITIYMALRFNRHFAIAGVLVLLQDVIISLGFVSLCGIEFDLTLMAAFLTIIGYCINDTVVIYDRIRRNLVNNIGKKVEESVSVSINQTIKRSIITSFVTLLAVFGILFFSNQSIVNFGLVVGFGIIIGTLGSIFVASVLPIKIGLKPYVPKIEIEKDPSFYIS